MYNRRRVEDNQRAHWIRFLAGSALVTSVGACAVAIESPPGTVGGAGCDEEFGDSAASPFVLPYREGQTYRVIQGYCPPNPNWGHQGWYAYDFDLATGDTVIASRSGRIWFVRENQPDIGGRCGVNGENMIIVLHDDGTAMHYVHLTTDGALVEEDTRVDQGQPIGLSGNSGCSSGPHLHVVLFRHVNAFSKEDSAPLNYRNAIGPPDENGGLAQGAEYTAAAYEPAS